MFHLHFGLRTRFLIISSVFLLVINLIFGSVFLYYAKNMVKLRIQAHMLDAVSVAASLVDGDMYEKVTDSNGHSPEYNHVLNVLSMFYSKSSLEYVYGIRAVSRDKYIFTIDPAPVNAAVFGDAAVKTDALVKAFDGVASVCDVPYSDSYGRFYTAYAPIRNSFGSVVGVVAADFDADWFDKQIWEIGYIIIFSCVLSLLIGAGIVCLFFNSLRKRFYELNEEMKMLAADLASFMQKITRMPYVFSKDSSLGMSSGIDSFSNAGSLDEIRSLGYQIRSIRQNLQDYIEKVYSLAFKDPLTGVKSKQAYTEFKKFVNQLILDGEVYPFAVAVFDINGLKQVNDTFGHQKGDLLIISASSLICSAFAYSPVFRIGGDEFVAVLKDSDFNDRAALFDAFYRQVCDNIKCGKVVIAVGFSDFIASKDNTFEDVFVRADKNMYECKSELKDLELAEL